MLKEVWNDGKSREKQNHVSHRCAIFAFRLAANKREAWYIAAGVQLSGLVQCNTSSQFDSAGIILNGFGSLPDRYLLNTSPTLRMKTLKRNANNKHAIILTPITNKTTIRQPYNIYTVTRSVEHPKRWKNDTQKKYQLKQVQRIGIYCSTLFTSNLSTTQYCLQHIIFTMNFYTKQKYTNIIQNAV